MPEPESLPEQDQPVASRPYMPDYDILDSQAGVGLLPWSWATQRLAEAHNYWIATVHPNGRPHMAPVWGIWLDQAFYFSTGGRSRKARNLAAGPRCVVSTESATQVVILEGIAEKVAEPELLKRITEIYTKKYQWPVEPTQDGVVDEHGNGGPVFAVRPQVVFGFNEDLTGSATRWRFSDY